MAMKLQQRSYDRTQKVRKSPPQATERRKVFPIPATKITNIVKKIKTKKYLRKKA